MGLIAISQPQCGLFDWSEAQAPNESLVPKRFQSHAQCGVVFILQSDEPKGLQAARLRFAPYGQKLCHASNDTLACLK